MGMYEKAMMEAGVSDINDCYFIDDSYGTPTLHQGPDAVNVVGAKTFGWKHIVHLLFPEDPIPPPQEGIHQIYELEDLKLAFPELFRWRYPE
jgi:pyrimidine and pyridine-specific 5'-nucleotidase